MATHVPALDLRLRDAHPEDAPQAAPLIHAAGPNFFNQLFGPEPEHAVRLFAFLFRQPRNFFSYEDAIVAEREGVVVGLAIAASGKRHRSDEPRMFWLVPRSRGLPALLRRLPHVLDAMRCTPAPPDDAYYLTIIAVAPDLRQCGVGSRLLAEVHRRAAQAGCSRTALHVESDNTGARRFYERHGYTATEERRPRRLAGISGFVAMSRPLEAE